MNHSSCRETVATLKPCNAKHGTWSIQALVAVSSLLTSVSSQGHAAAAFRGAGGSPLPRTRRALPLGPREPRSRAQDRAPETVLDFFFCISSPCLSPVWVRIINRWFRKVKHCRLILFTSCRWSSFFWKATFESSRKRRWAKFMSLVLWKQFRFHCEETQPSSMLWDNYI